MNGGFGGRRWVTGVGGGAGDHPTVVPARFDADSDPVPTALFDRVRFALDPVFDAGPGAVDVLRPSGRWPIPRPGSRRRLVVLRCDDLTVTLVARLRSDGFRLVGRLSPAGPGTVVLRTVGGPLLGACDGRGRFALAPVPSGLVQLVLRRPGRRPLVGPAVWL